MTFSTPYTTTNFDERKSTKVKCAPTRVVTPVAITVSIIMLVISIFSPWLLVHVNVKQQQQSFTKETFLEGFAQSVKLRLVVTSVVILCLTLLAIGILSAFCGGYSSKKWSSAGSLISFSLLSAACIIHIGDKNENDYKISHLDAVGSYGAGFFLALVSTFFVLVSLVTSVLEPTLDSARLKASNAVARLLSPGALLLSLMVLAMSLLAPWVSETWYRQERQVFVYNTDKASVMVFNSIGLLALTLLSICYKLFLSNSVRSGATVDSFVGSFAVTMMLLVTCGEHLFAIEMRNADQTRNETYGLGFYLTLCSAVFAYVASVVSTFPKEDAKEDEKDITQA